MSAEIAVVSGVGQAEPGTGIHLPDPGSAASGAPRAHISEAAVINPPDDVGLVFEINQQSHELVIKVMDLKTKQIIREIPPAEIRQMRATMQLILGVVLDRTG